MLAVVQADPLHEEALPTAALFQTVVSPTPLPSSTPLPTATPLPTLTPTPTPQPCTQTQGKVELSSLPSQVFGSKFNFRIYLPPCYSPTTEPGYPVLYLLHGLWSTDDQWQRMGIDTTADQLITSGQIPPLLIVMPRDPSTNDPSVDPFDQALANELVPWIDAHYPTRPDRTYRAIGGLSRGAGWAIHIGFTHWDLFGAMGGHSLALFYNDSVDISSYLKGIPTDQMPRVYLDIGRGDGALASVVQFEAVLDQWDVPHEWHLNNGYHEEAYWTSHLEQYLKWYTQGW